jgi:hypothetical protein
MGRCRSRVSSDKGKGPPCSGRVLLGHGRGGSSPESLFLVRLLTQSKPDRPRDRSEQDRVDSPSLREAPPILLRGPSLAAHSRDRESSAHHSSCPLPTRTLAFALLVFLLTSLAVANELFGSVLGVTDGDSVRVLVPPDRSLSVRLSEIDAPTVSADCKSTGATIPYASSRSRGAAPAR